MQFFKLAAATAVVAGAVDGAADSDSAGASYRIEPCDRETLKAAQLERRPNIKACKNCNANSAVTDRALWVDCYKKEIKNLFSNSYQSSFFGNEPQAFDYNKFPNLFQDIPHQRPVLGSLSRMRFGPEFMAQRGPPQVVVKSALSNNNAESPCEAPMSTRGLCRALIANRWTYNQETGKCESFDYGGCGKTANYFNQKRDCTKTCEGSNTGFSSEAEDEADDVDMKGGWGFGNIGKPNAHNFNRQGLNFYGPGADSNENDFSLPKCQQDMLKSGMGRAMIPYFSYNKTAKVCQQKSYGGFGDKNTDNWFEHLNDCIKECEHW